MSTGEIHCPTCGYDNPSGMKFCGACGAPLGVRCPACGFENQPGFRFCGACGTPLVAASAAAPSLETKPTAPPEAEHRQLTVMFCDLVGSTALSERVDPEELREIIRAYQAASTKVLARFGGHIAQYLGDGLLAYFGYPAAHEDDAQRAVRAGLGIVEAVRMLSAQLEQEQDVRLAVRIGIHTGLVVVGEMGSEGRHEHLALGRTPNVAARIHAAAAPDTVVISEATWRLVRGLFDGRGLGLQAIKGLSQPMALYQVLHESAARNRFEAAATAGLTPLVGRAQEVALLLQRWEQVKEGFGHVVLLSGEAGIGKSRLLQALKEEAARDAQAWLVECLCSPYHQSSALYPIIDLFARTVLQFGPQEPPSEKLDKLEGLLVQYGFALPDVAPLFAALLSVPLQGRYPPSSLTPERQKQKLLQAVLTMLLERAARQPVLFIVEDVHWADPSTLELLDQVVEQGSTARLLTLLTFRPDFARPWSVRPHVAHTHITLTRLPREQVERLALLVARGRTLPPGVLADVVRKTDGVPLFVEELTKVVLESDLMEEQAGHYALKGNQPQLAVPATLRDSLMARLDRQGPAKEVAQLAATLGRSFSFELLHTVSQARPEALQRALQSLVEAELLYQRGLPPQATYVFKHILIQETAYQSLLRARRQQYHRQIAQVLERQFPETVETQPELLAHHYTAAGEPGQAVAYWQAAGQRALERSANAEAIAHLTRGLGLLSALPDGAERAQQELTLLITLGPAMIAAKGYAAPDVAQTYTRARELCSQVGETPQRFSALLGLFAFYFGRAELPAARELAEQLLAFAERTQDAAMLIEAHLALGETLVLMGALAPGQDHLEKGSARYASLQHRAPVFLSGDDPGVACLCWEAWALWLRGHPDRALEKISAALDLAAALAHPFGIAYARTIAAWIHQFRGEAPAAQHHAEQTIAIAEEQGYAFWLAGGTFVRGAALAAQGQIEEGLAVMRQGLDGWQDTGAAVGTSCYLALLAQVYERAALPDEGLGTLAEALALVERTGERCWEAELHRLQGALLQRAGRPEAEAHFRRALEIAKAQGAVSWALRAAVSLARLLQHQGQAEAARDVLAPLYGAFADGLATADLEEARVLLHAGSSGS